VSRRGPPPAAEALARRLLAPRQAERLLADLAEEYLEYQRPRRGSRGADAWYWRQVLKSAWALRIAAVASPGGTRSRLPPILESLAREVRWSVRGLLRSPTFSGSATLTLALGIGATTAIFSVLHAVVLRSLPYRDSDRIVRAWDNTRDGDITEFSFRVVEYRELRAHSDVFERVGAEFPLSTTVLVDGQEPQQVQGRMVTADLFEVFGVEPVLGRMFTDEEIAAGDRPLVVVSHGFWSRYLGADPGSVGGRVELDGRAFTVLGVLPASYEHVSDPDAQVFVPYTLGTSGWTGHWLDVYGRLRPGIGLGRATQEIDAALAAAGNGGASDRWYATVATLRDAVVGDVRAPIWAIFVMVGLVLVLACVNVASLTLARSVSRSAEMAVRRSLGARRGRLLRMLLLESLLVAAAGGATGILLAAAMLRVLIGLAPPWIPRIAETALDPLVLGFAVLVTVATAVAFGLGPALVTTRSGTSQGIAAAGRGGTGSRGSQALLGGLVVAEVALTVTLLTAAGLTVRTLRNLQSEEMGFDRARALTFRINVPRARYPTSSDVDDFYDRLQGALRALPGVTAVGAGTDLPLSGEGAVATVNSEERLQAGAVEGVTVLQRRATEGLFQALGTPLLEGRGIDASDRADGERIVVVSSSLARALFGDGSAVGRRIGWGDEPREGDWMTIVGVVADVRYESPDRAPDPQLYQAHPQSTTRDMAVVVRTTDDPVALVEAARATLRALDPAIPAYSMGTLGGLVDIALAGRRFTMTLLGLFAALAVALTVAGLYGVLSFAVGRRRREIGVRIAVGARGSDVARLVLARGLSLVGLGLTAGLAGAYLAGRLLEGLLFRVPPFDPATFGVVSTLLVGVALVACLVPARGASAVDPVQALRE